MNRTCVDGRAQSSQIRCNGVHHRRTRRCCIHPAPFTCCVYVPVCWLTLRRAPKRRRRRNPPVGGGWWHNTRSGSCIQGRCRSWGRSSRRPAELAVGTHTLPLSCCISSKTRHHRSLFFFFPPLLEHIVSASSVFVLILLLCAVPQ